MRGGFLLLGFLFYNYLGAWGCFAGKAAGSYFAELNNTVFGCVNSKLLTHNCARAGQLSLANLAHNNFASADFLAAKALNTKPLAG